MCVRVCVCVCVHAYLHVCRVRADVVSSLLRCALLMQLRRKSAWSDRDQLPSDLTGTHWTRGDCGG